MTYILSTVPYNYRADFVVGNDGIHLMPSMDDPSRPGYVTIVGGGGGGPVTIADGADVAQGTTTDAPSTAVEDGTARTEISLLKGIKNNTRGLVQFEDVASANADPGIGCLAVRKATPANTSGADGDYEFIQMSAGRIWASVVVDSPLPAGTAIVGKVGPSSGPFTDRSGTITTGNSAQTLAAINAARQYLFIQNNSTGDLWINFTTAAVLSQPSIRLISGSSMTFISFLSTELVSIIGATTGQAFTAKEG